MRPQRRLQHGSGRAGGKSALVSGGARGIGAAAAMTLAREGADVIVADVRDEVGESTVRRIQRLGGTAAYVHLDVADEKSWQLAIDSTLRAYGRLNVLVNNAGIYFAKELEATTVAEWDRLITVNLRGVFLGTRAAIPAMREAGGGSIINMSSTAGIVGSPIAAAYSASKGGVRMLTKSTALEYAKENIRCNSIHPGPIATDLAADVDDPTMARERIARVPMRRIGRPEEVASAVLFLASDESSFMTGSELVVDGGRTAQ